MLMMPGSYLQTRRKFNPRQISGLGLWLDASDASTITIATGVSQWNDKSGNGRNFSQGTGGSQPVVRTADQNGRDTVDFDGTDDIVSISTGLDLFNNVPGASLFCVKKHDATAATQVILFATNNADGPTRFGLSSRYIASVQRRTAQGRRLDADSFAAIDGAGTVGTNYEMQASMFDCTNAFAYVYADGTLDGSGAFQTSGNTSATNSVAITVGNSRGSEYFNGKLAEVLAFPRFLSSTERQTVEGYLAHKWGLASSLPSTHPYRFAAP